MKYTIVMLISRKFLFTKYAFACFFFHMIANKQCNFTYSCNLYTIQNVTKNQKKKKKRMLPRTNTEYKTHCKKNVLIILYMKY